MEHHAEKERFDRGRAGAADVPLLFAVAVPEETAHEQEQGQNVDRHAEQAREHIPDAPSDDRNLFRDFPHGATVGSMTHKLLENCAGHFDLFAPDKQENAAARYGAAIGAAFQIRDDMLDVLSTESELGKPIGSDREEKKNTYMALYGEEKCASLVESLTAAAKDAVRECFADTEFLCSLADSLATRRN